MRKRQRKFPGLSAKIFKIIYYSFLSFPIIKFSPYSNFHSFYTSVENSVYDDNISLSWVFISFFKLRKWYQIAQNISFKQTCRWELQVCLSMYKLLVDTRR